MKIKPILLLNIILFFACTNEPLKPYKLNKTELKNAQKAYESSTIQHQKVQSKSIITITKNETKVLAMIEIYQNWKLDSLEERFEPIEEKAKAKLTYFENDCKVTFSISSIQKNDIEGKYQLIESMLSHGTSNSHIDLGTIETIPLEIDFNNQEFKNDNCPSFTRRHALLFESNINENGIIILKINDSETYTKKVNNESFTFDFVKSILTKSKKTTK